MFLVDGAHELVQSPSFPVRALALRRGEREHLGAQFGGLLLVGCWRLLGARSWCEQRGCGGGGGELAESSHLSLLVDLASLLWLDTAIMVIER